MTWINIANGLKCACIVQSRPMGGGYQNTYVTSVVNIIEKCLWEWTFLVKSLDIFRTMARTPQQILKIYINQHFTHELLCNSICLYPKYSIGFTVTVPMDEPKYTFSPLSANPTKWSNTLKQFVCNNRQFVWVQLTIL